MGRWAEQLGVSREFLELLSQGSLDGDATFIEALITAAERPDLWTLASPRAKSVLFLQEQQVARLGGTRADLLALYLESHRLLAHPSNRNYAREYGVLRHVSDSLKGLTEEHERDRVRGFEQRAEKIVVNARNAARVGAAKKQADPDSPHNQWARELVTRKPGRTKGETRQEIADREGIKPGSVKKALQRLRRKNRGT
jgi:hypothetical protein